MKISLEMAVKVKKIRLSLSLLKPTTFILQLLLAQHLERDALTHLDPYMTQVSVYCPVCDEFMCMGESLEAYRTLMELPIKQLYVFPSLN